MNFFESELEKIMGQSSILKDQKYVGRICYGSIDGDLKARVEFVTLGVSSHYAGIKASVINRKEGVVDSILLRFEDIWGKQRTGNPNFREGVSPISGQTTEKASGMCSIRERQTTAGLERRWRTICLCFRIWQ